jgi:hypothetical protein
MNGRNRMGLEGVQGVREVHGQLSRSRKGGTGKGDVGNTAGHFGLLGGGCEAMCRMCELKKRTVQFLLGGR